MAPRRGLLIGLSTLALTGAVAVAGCGGEGARDGGGETPVAKTHGAHARMAGEGGGAATAATDNVAYITQLLLVRGHLQAGVALYAAGEPGPAAVHMKHPRDELYASLLPAFEARGAAGFAAPLGALADSVADGQSLDDVSANLAAAHAGVDAAIGGAGASPKEVLLAMAETLRVAGDEFDIGVKDGAIVNDKEYQDAYGFMTTVVEYLGLYDPGPGALGEAVAAARAQAGLALAVAPSVTPRSILSTSQAIYEAAARVEIIARGL